MARMRDHIEFMADKERIYEGAVLPVCGHLVAVVTEFPSAAPGRRPGACSAQGAAGIRGLNNNI
jgi:hypothetical protein